MIVVADRFVREAVAMPVLGLEPELPTARGGDRVELRLAVVIGRDRLDAAGNAVAIQA
jgi:hypothetical protein